MNKIIKEFWEGYKKGELIEAEEVVAQIEIALDSQSQETMGEIEQYEEFCLEELNSADEKSLVMIAYDMHSRLVAIRHVKDRLLKTAKG